MKQKKLLIGILFLFFCINVFGLENPVFFVENWNVSGNNFIDNCNNIDRLDINSQWNITTDDFLDGTEWGHDNVWYCLQYSTDTNSNWYQDSILFRTSKSINSADRLGGACVTPSNCRFSLSSIFTQPMNFGEGSQINFSCGYMTGIANNYIYFSKDGVEDGFSFLIGGSVSPVGYPNNICDIKTISQCSDLQINNVSITYENLTEFCNFDTNDIQGIERIELRSVFGSDITGNFSIDDISILAFNGSNALPVFNLSTEDRKLNYCLNESDLENQYEINISIDVFDEENNTIYYASSYGQASNISKRVNYFDYRNAFGIPCNPNDFFSCIVFFNFDFVDNVVYPFDDMCIVEQSYFYNFSRYNVIFRNDVYGNLIGGLEILSTLCDGGNKRYVYKTEIPVSPFFYEAFFYDVAQGLEPDNFNLTFYDSSFSEKVKINFITEPDNLNISYWNGSNLVYLSNISRTSLYENDSFQVSIGDIVQTNITLLILAYDDLYIYNFNDLINNDNPLRYIEISTDENTRIVHGNFEYAGVVSAPSFGTEKPKAFNASVGLNTYTLFVSDSQHQPNDYRVKTVSVRLSTDGNCVTAENVDIYGIPNTGISELDSLITGFRGIREALDNFGMSYLVMLAIKGGLLLFMFREYAKQWKNPGFDSKNFFRGYFIIMFVIVTVLYFILLIEKSWFIVFSILGILYFSREILNMSGSIDNADGETSITYTLAFFWILITIWFGFMQVASGTDLGFPEFGIYLNYPQDFGITTILFFIGNFSAFILDLFFSVIPDVPTIINIVLSLLKIMSLFAFSVYIKNAGNPLH